MTLRDRVLSYFLLGVCLIFAVMLGSMTELTQ
jgi:hypothetical protein